MSLYQEHVLPRIINVLCGVKLSQPLRAEACSGLSGRVLEIGFGSGLNVPHYPTDVTRVDAIEPSDVAWHLARDRVEESPVEIERTGRDAQQLPFADATFDSALSTWTMCTIPDAALALAEVRRVLKPGGTLHFLEHGKAPDEGVRRWQERLEPLQIRMAGGCHLTRQIPDLVESAGLQIESLDAFYQEQAPKPLAALTVGVATTPT
ncbi:MAG TPA: class I SAM-dependent methyltransferase [Actinomycetes bacterium]|nr:class I SAM-dependent methyltransferase [Actinomycetes bacterium]